MFGMFWVCFGAFGRTWCTAYYPEPKNGVKPFCNNSIEKVNEFQILRGANASNWINSIQNIFRHSSKIYLVEHNAACNKNGQS